MRRRLVTVASAATVLVCATLTGASGAAADPVDRLGGFDPEPWQEYRSEDTTLPAGEYCSFPLRIEVIEDEEMTRVDARYEDGSVRVNEYKGKLVVDFINVETGRTERRDVSARGWEELRPDGSPVSLTGIGPFGIRFTDADVYPQGYYVVDGFHVISYDEDGRRDMPVAVGTEENMCESVAGPAN